MAKKKKQTLYLLQNAGAGYVGDLPLFWKEGGSGYTPLIDEAKRWTWAETRRQIRSSKGSHHFVAWNLEDVEKCVVRVVSIEALSRAANDRRIKKRSRTRCTVQNAEPK